MSERPKRRFRRRRLLPPSKKKITVALVGNPNVGKSVIFNSWTGLGAIVSNYPGTTVEILEGTVFLPYHDIYSPRWRPGIRDWDLRNMEEPQQAGVDEEFEPSRSQPGWRQGWRRRWRHKREDETHGIGLRIVDLPGSYTIISPTSEDERVTLRYLHQHQPDVIINIIDATNLHRNLILTLALLEFNIPLVVCLNQVDLARSMGIEIDITALERLLGVPVIATIATQGKNLKLLLRVAVRATLVRRRRRKKRRLIFPDGIEEKLGQFEQRLVQLNACPLDLPLRIVSQQLLEGYPECIKCLSDSADSETVLTSATKLREELETEFEADVVLVLGERRLDYANYIAEQVQKGEGERVPLTERISAILTHRIFGLPIAVFVLIGSLFLIFGVGSLFDATIGTFWEEVINPSFDTFFNTFIPIPLLRTILYYGLILGLQGWLFVAIPYVATFYLILAVMEDTGYLARVAFMLDGLMHRIGLHGRAIIPILLGMGCNVPAVLGTRILNTKKERAIAAFLVILVPCSAQLAVILGTVALYGSILFAFVIYAIVVIVIVVLGALLQHTLPGASLGLVMEVPPLRLPRLKPMSKKTWIRFKEFLYIALPMIIVGSAILGVLLETGFLFIVVAPLSPIVVGWLGLPAITAVALVYGILRKELTVELLIVLSLSVTGLGLEALMSIRQMFVFALFTTLYIPCIATVAVLADEQGWKYTLLTMASTLVIALLGAGLANALLVTLGIP